MTEVQQPVDYKEIAINALTIVAPPAAIAMRQGKSDLDSRHLALSLALYFSFIFYLPSVLHAYWLLHIRDDGGFEHWGDERVKDVKGIWAKYEPAVSERVQPYWQPVATATEHWYAVGKEWQQWIVAKYEQVAALLRTIKEHTVEVADDAFMAYKDGELAKWIGDKAKVAVDKMKSWCESYPRVKALIVYVEERLPALINFATHTWTTVKEYVAYFINHLPSSTAEAVEIGRAALSQIPTPVTTPAASVLSSPTANGTASHAKDSDTSVQEDEEEDDVEEEENHENETSQEF